MAAKKQKLSISMDVDLTKRLDRLAKVLKSNRSAVIEDLCTDALEQNELTMRASSDPVVMGAFMRALVEPGVMKGLASAVRDDLTDEQMKLFKAATEQLHEQAKKQRRR